MKYKNRKIHNSHGVFDSLKEFNRFLELIALQKAGVICELKREVTFELVPPVKFSNEVKRKPAIRYIADFTYVRNDTFVIEDVKSEITRKLPVYRIKKHLMLAFLNFEITEI